MIYRTLWELFIINKTEETWMAKDVVSTSINSQQTVNVFIHRSDATIGTGQRSIWSTEGLCCFPSLKWDIISRSEICTKTVPLVFYKTFQTQNDTDSTIPHTKKYVLLCLLSHKADCCFNHSEPMNWQNNVKKKEVTYMFWWKHSYTEYLKTKTNTEAFHKKKKLTL